MKFSGMLTLSAYSRSSILPLRYAMKFTNMVSMLVVIYIVASSLDAFALGCSCEEKYLDETERVAGEAVRILYKNNNYIDVENFQTEDRSLPHEYIKSVLFSVYMRCQEAMRIMRIKCATGKSCKGGVDPIIREFVDIGVVTDASLSEELLKCQNLLSRLGMNEMSREIKELRDEYLRNAVQIVEYYSVCVSR